MQLYLDSDGVVADFDTHVFNLFGQKPQGMNDDRMWELINATPDFWPTMPIKAGGRELWAAVKHLNPIVLTGCPKSDYERSSAHKVEWWLTNWEHKDVITCLSRDKALHMEQPGDVLVDDMRKNLKRWEKAGGVGVLYRTADQAIADLRQLGII